MRAFASGPASQKIASQMLCETLDILMQQIGAKIYKVLRGSIYLSAGHLPPRVT